MPEKYNVDSSLIWKPDPQIYSALKLSLKEYLERYADLLDKFIMVNRPVWEKQFKSRSDLTLVGGVILDVASYLHIDPVFILGAVLHESAAGTSPISKDKKNVLGWMAFDQSPYSSAGFFCSYEGCIFWVMNRIRVNYFLETGRYYHGATLRGLNTHYSTDKVEPKDPLTWAEKVCLWMNRIDKFLTENKLIT